MPNLHCIIFPFAAFTSVHPPTRMISVTLPTSLRCRSLLRRRGRHSVSGARRGRVSIVKRV